MNWLKNLPIKKRLPVIFTFIAVLLLITGFAGVFGVSTISPIVSDMYEQKLLPVNNINHVSRNWLTIRLANFTAMANQGGEEEAFRKGDSVYKEILSLMKTYDNQVLSQQHKELLQQYHQLSRRYWDARQQVVQLVLAGSKQEALAISNGEANEAMKDLTQVIDGMIEIELNEAIAYNQSAQQTARTVDLSVISVLAIAFVCTVFFAVTLTRSIVNPLVDLDGAARRVADGDLDTVVKADTKDEIGSLAASFNAMIGAVQSSLEEVEKKSAEADHAAQEAKQALESVTMLATEVRLATNEVTQYTTDISSSVQQMASAIQEQAKQASEVAAASEEMAQTISETAQSITITSQSSTQASEASRSGSAVVERTRSSMQTIADVTGETSKKIDALTLKVEEVGSISETITEIADQTNLLALNAAIEAARAGTHGRGFAVVADEVRKLAERTAKATRDIATVLKSIQQETLDAHESMARAGTVVTRELESSNVLTEAFDRINRETNQVSALINQIAVASEEQSTTMAEVSRTIEGMHVVAEQSAAGVHQIAQATNHLSELTANLRTMVDQFSSDDGEVAQEKSNKQVFRPHTNGVARQKQKV